MDSIPVPAVNSEEGIFLENDASTAETTPEGSPAFSPVLRPRPDEYLDMGMASLVVRSTNLSLSSALLHNTTPSVRNICCVGAGYVGGPTSAVIAYQNPNIRVAVVDRDERRIRQWNSQHLPIYEPGLRDIVRIGRDGSRECSFESEAEGANTSDIGSDESSYSECGSLCEPRQRAPIVVPARQPNLFFSTNVSQCIRDADIVLVAVNTPTKSRGVGAGSATDMATFEAVMGVVAQHARPGAIVVEKSTVPCRTAHLVKETMSTHRPGVHFEILSNPEFLAAGTAIADLMRPDRVLIGSSTTPSGRRAAEALASVYAAWVPRSRIITTNVWSSELSKLVANSMLAQRISSINSISAICEKTGADVDEVARSVGYDPRIGDKFLKAGIGFGGSCFKKDILSLVYLAESLNLDEVGAYWRQVVKMNEYQRDRFSLRVVECLNNTLVGKKITLLGYAFKANTSDTRESPAFEIIKTLLQEGPGEIAVFDPCCNPLVVREEIRTLLKGQTALRTEGGPIVVYDNAYEACASSHAVLITTECDEFRNTPGTLLPAMSGSTTTLRTTITKVPAGLLDPRPFSSLEPTETELLSLHKFLLHSVPTSTYSDDPLKRYDTEPQCAEDCPDCGLGKSNRWSTAGNSDKHRAKEKLDWNKISYHLSKPKWVFDGKGIIDANALMKMGVKVESVGRQSLR